MTIPTEDALILTDQDPNFFEGVLMSKFGEGEHMSENGAIRVEFNNTTVAADALYDAGKLVKDKIISSGSIEDYIGDINAYVILHGEYRASGGEIDVREQQSLDQKLGEVQGRHPELSQLYEITPMEASFGGNKSDIVARFGARLDESESFIMKMSVSTTDGVGNIAINFYADDPKFEMHLEDKLDHVREHFKDDLGAIQELGLGEHNDPAFIKGYMEAVEVANKELGGIPASPLMMSNAAKHRLENVDLNNDQNNYGSIMTASETSASVATITL